MEPIFFVMAILGCADGGSRCTDARVLSPRYASAAQCQAALPGGLAANTDVPFPTIMADCRQSGQRIVRIDVPAKARG